MNVLPASLSIDRGDGRCNYVMPPLKLLKVSHQGPSPCACLGNQPKPYPSRWFS